MPILTKRQKEIFDYTANFIQKNGFAPTFEEIKDNFKLSALSTVHQHIDSLVNKNLLIKKSNSARGLEIAELNEEMITIPLSGLITAGMPIEAIEEYKTITIPKNFLTSSGRHYALKVKGESMIDEGIFDGDTVILREQQTAENGQTVVAIINQNEATLKKFYREDGKFRLQPRNQKLLPIFTNEVEIRGIIVKIISNLDCEQESKNSLKYRKKIFLDRIRSSNSNSKNKYKRVVESPIRYAGGKSLAVGFIAELLPDSVKKLVSPFFGGGSVEIACNKFLGLDVVGYDIFDILINYWDVQINQPKKLADRLSKLEPNQETYKSIKEELKAHWKKEKKLKPLDLAMHYYFNHNLSYGPGFLGWPSSVYMDKNRYDTMLNKVRNFNANNMEVKCGSFEKAFEEYPNDFFYCDPPYLLGEDSKMFIGIYPMRNFPVHHNGFNHEKLLDLLKKHKGGFVLSYNNCKTIREWYKNFKQHFPEWQYTMGQGETRVGKNRINSKINHIKESHEILIYSPPRI